MNQETVENTKRIFMPGLMVILVSMSGEPNMTRGTKGLVTHVNDMGLVHVKWESGSSLTLSPEEDTYILVQYISGLAYLQQCFAVAAETELKYREYQHKDGFDRYVSAAEFGEMLEEWAFEVFGDFLDVTKVEKVRTEPIDITKSYNHFLCHLWDTHEIDKHNPYVKISSLTRLKEYFKRPGAKIKILRHQREELVGLTLQINKAQTNGVYLHVHNNLDHVISKANGGRGRFMEYYKTANYCFGDTVQVYEGTADARSLISEFQVLPCHFTPEGDA